MFRRRQSDREFMRELVLRMQRSERLMVSELAESRRVLIERMDRSERRIVAEIAESRRTHEESMVAIRDELTEGRAEWREEQRAFHEALFRILDRLDRLGPGDAPA